MLTEAKIDIKDSSTPENRLASSMHPGKGVGVIRAPGFQYPTFKTAHRQLGQAAITRISEWASCALGADIECLKVHYNLSALIEIALSAKHTKRQEIFPKHAAFYPFCLYHSCQHRTNGCVSCQQMVNSPQSHHSGCLLGLGQSMRYCVYFHKADLTLHPTD